jgi:hypothetical protein
MEFVATLRQDSSLRRVFPSILRDRPSALLRMRGIAALVGGGPRFTLNVVRFAMANGSTDKL